MMNPAQTTQSSGNTDGKTTIVSAGISRRGLASAGAATGVGLMAAAAAAQSTFSNPGPENKPLQQISPSSDKPPVTDGGAVQQFWQSFSQAHRRIQPGGWSRQVNVKDFPISRDMTGVNMRLEAGGIRELHWHAAAEWALMLTGNARITALDLEGKPFIKDVGVGDLWAFQQGIPHSIQGLGPDGCEFLLVFDEGTFSEEETTLLTDWVVHTPRDVVAKNFGVPVGALQPFDDIPKAGRFIFPAAVPPALSADVAALTKNYALSKQVFNFSMLAMKPTKENAAGSIRIVDSNVFKASNTIAAAYVVVKPGCLRELHWHPNADEWQYYVSGNARMTLFMNRSEARTLDFAASDIGYVPSTMPHYIENMGTTDLVFLEMFKSPVYQDISLNNWIRGIPPELARQHLSISDDTLAAVPTRNLGTLR